MVFKLFGEITTSSKTTLSKNGLLLQYIEKQNVEFCLAAIKNNPKALKFAQKQTREMCLHH